MFDELPLEISIKIGIFVNVPNNKIESD